MSGFPESPFWSYSLDLYGRPGASAACLALQDRRGLDVNLLLYCCWRAAEGHGPLSEDSLRGAIEATQPWQREVVVAVRAVRRRLKGGFPPAPGALVAALRDRLVAIETDCEQLEQQMLFELASAAPAVPVPEPDRAAMAAANLKGYCELSGGRPDAADIEDLIALLCCAFPEADRASLSRWFATDPR